MGVEAAQKRIDEATQKAYESQGDPWSAYVRNYPDLLAAYNASGGGQSMSAWGRAHYDAYGRGEGRNVPEGAFLGLMTNSGTSQLGPGSYTMPGRPDEPGMWEWNAARGEWVGLGVEGEGRE